MVISGADLLSSLSPYIHVLASSSTTEHCSHCFQGSTDLKRCSKCHRVSYCSVSCQRHDWIYHKHECPHLSAITEEYDLTRLFLRLILRYSKDQGVQSTDTKRSFDELTSHETDIRQDRRRCRTFQSLYQSFQQWSLLSAYDQNDLFRLFCRLVINTLTIHDTIDLKPIGYGLYLDATVYNHSCQPTCHTIFNGIALSIRTIVDQSIDPEWTINYIDLLEPYDNRQAFLRENYYFQCQCQRCASKNRDELILLEKIRSEEQRMDKAISDTQFDRAYQFSQLLCEYYNEILPYYHAYVALHHVKHFKLELLLAETVPNAVLQSTMRTTCARLQISMGDHHPLTQEAMKLRAQYQLEMAMQHKQIQ